MSPTTLTKVGNSLAIIVPKTLRAHGVVEKGLR